MFPLRRAMSIPNYYTNDDLRQTCQSLIGRVNQELAGNGPGDVHLLNDVMECARNIRSELQALRWGNECC